MGKLRAFVTVTKSGGIGPGADVPSLTVRATPDQFLDETTEIEVDVFVSPDLWLDNITVSCSDSGGRWVGQMGAPITEPVTDEPVTLQGDNVEPATGSSQYPIRGGFEATTIGGIGDDFEIQQVEPGRNGLKTRGPASAAVGKIDYSAIGRRWRLTNLTNETVAIEALLDTGDET